MNDFVGLIQEIHSRTCDMLTGHSISLSGSRTFRERKTIKLSPNETDKLTAALPDKLAWQKKYQRPMWQVWSCWNEFLEIQEINRL